MLFTLHVSPSTMNEVNHCKLMKQGWSPLNLNNVSSLYFLREEKTSTRFVEETIASRLLDQAYRIVVEDLLEHIDLNLRISYSTNRVCRIDDGFSQGYSLFDRVIKEQWLVDGKPHRVSGPAIKTHVPTIKKTLEAIWAIRSCIVPSFASILESSDKTTACLEYLQAPDDYAFVIQALKNEGLPLEATFAENLLAL